MRGIAFSSRDSIAMTLAGAVRAGGRRGRAIGAARSPRRHASVPDAALGYVPHEVLVGYRPGPVAAVTSDHRVAQRNPSERSVSRRRTRRVLGLPGKESVTVGDHASAPRARRQLCGAELHRACGRPFLPRRPRPRPPAPRLGADAVEHAAADRSRRPRCPGAICSSTTRPGGCGGDDRDPRQRRRVPQLGQVPQVAGLHAARTSSTPMTSSPRTSYPLDRNRPRDVRRRRDRRAHQQRSRPHRPGIRHLDHAGPSPQRERRGRRVDDRRRDPLRRQARSAGDQPEPRVSAQPGHVGVRDTADRGARSTTPTPTASPSSELPATTRAIRSPTPPARET